jgi:hypothetical protein
MEDNIIDLQRHKERKANETRIALVVRYLAAVKASDHDTIIAILNDAGKDAQLEAWINEANEEMIRWSGWKNPAWIEALDTPAAIRAWFAQIGVDLPASDTEPDVTSPSSR